MRAARGAAALCAALAITACSNDPVLVDGSGLPGVDVTEQNRSLGSAPGWTWCEELAPNLYTATRAPSTGLAFDDGGEAGAVVIDRSRDGATADYFVERLGEAAARCADSDLVGEGYSIEPLADLPDGQVGWRTGTPDGEWGELVLVPLDRWRVLAAGFATTEEEPPVDRDELVALAEQGAEQFPPARG